MYGFKYVCEKRNIKINSVRKVLMCKTAHKHLLHQVVGLYCGLCLMVLLVWLIAGLVTLVGTYTTHPDHSNFPPTPYMCMS